MKISKLSNTHCFEISSDIYSDERGHFQEAFRHDFILDETGISFIPKQMNSSKSSFGVMRGIHFAEENPGQSKYVTVAKGKILDFVIDLNISSDSFGKWDVVELAENSGKSVLIPSGHGHAFISLEEGTVVNYLVSSVYNPGIEHSIDVFDRKIGLHFPIPREEILLSKKDAQAMSLDSAISAGILPRIPYRELFSR